MSVVGLLASMGTASAPPATQTVLSSVNKASDITLSNGDRDADSNTTAGGFVLSDAGKTSGKYYVECQWVQAASSLGFAFGLHRGTSNLSTYLGADTDGWATWTSSPNRRTFYNGVQSNDSNVGVPSLNIRARMAVDLDNGYLWLSYFGNTAWLGGGDPAAGTSPTYTFTPGATFYIALCPYHGVSSPTTSRNKLRLVLPANWASAAPSGFGVWTA